MSDWEEIDSIRSCSECHVCSSHHPCDLLWLQPISTLESIKSSVHFLQLVQRWAIFSASSNNVLIYLILMILVSILSDVCFCRYLCPSQRCFLGMYVWATLPVLSSPGFGHYRCCLYSSPSCLICWFGILGWVIFRDLVGQYGLIQVLDSSKNSSVTQGNVQNRGG